MHNISFALTEPQFLDASKDATRRMGWANLKPGDRLRAVRKAMGLKKGEKVHQLGATEIEPGGTKREGSPLMTPGEFINFFCSSHRDCFNSAALTQCTMQAAKQAR